MAGKQDDYLKGNTKEAAAEWDFRFVVSRPGNDKIAEAEVVTLFDKFLDSVDAAGLQLGGSFKPILDEDYERMAADQD